MAIGKVRTPGLNGQGTGPTPQYSFFGPVRPRESCSVTTCVGSGWFTLKKLPRCTPRTCKPLMLTVVSGSGLNSTARLACTPYGFLWFWSKRTTTDGPKKPQVEIGLQPGNGFSNGRPGYVPMVPPQDGSWQASKGAGIIPWNNPNPARTTTLRLVPMLYATPTRGSIFFHCVLSTFDGQVSHSQRRPALRVSLLVARHLS